MGAQTEARVRPPVPAERLSSDGGVAGERDDLREEADEEPLRVGSRDRVPYLCEPGGAGDEQPDPDDETRCDDDPERRPPPGGDELLDRKSTRLNSSH